MAIESSAGHSCRLPPCAGDLSPAALLLQQRNLALAASGGNRFVPIRRGRCGGGEAGGGVAGATASCPSGGAGAVRREAGGGGWDTRERGGCHGMPPLVNPFLKFRLPTASSLMTPPPRLLGDGFDGLAPLGDALKGRIRVQFIDEHGAAEAGVVGVVGCVWRQSGDWVCGESGGGEGRAMTG